MKMFQYKVTSKGPSKLIDLVNMEYGRQRFTPLHIFSARGNFVICRMLIEAGANCGALTLDHKWYPLKMVLHSHGNCGYLNSSLYTIFDFCKQNPLYSTYQVTSTANNIYIPGVETNIDRSEKILHFK